VTENQPAAPIGDSPAGIKAAAEAEAAKILADAKTAAQQLLADAQQVASEPAPAAPEEPAAPPEPTHTLLLSDGSAIPHYGAIPTLVHIGEEILSVVGAFERRSQP